MARSISFAYRRPERKAKPARRSYNSSPTIPVRGLAQKDPRNSFHHREAPRNGGEHDEAVGNEKPCHGNSGPQLSRLEAIGGAKAIDPLLYFDRPDEAGLPKEEKSTATIRGHSSPLKVPLRKTPVESPPSTMPVALFP